MRKRNGNKITGSIKRISAFALAAVVVFAAIPLSALTAEAETKEGSSDVYRENGSEKKDRELEFTDKQLKDVVCLDKEMLRLDFSVKVRDGSQAAVIYSVENDSANDSIPVSDIAAIDKDGILMVKNVGIIKVTAEVLEDDVYKEASVSFQMSIVNNEEKLISEFEKDTVDYILGTNELDEDRYIISDQQTEKIYKSSDMGSIIYSAEPGNETMEALQGEGYKDVTVGSIGLSIDESSGMLTVTDTDKLIEAYEKTKEADGCFEIKVKAEKTADIRSSESSGREATVFGTDEAYYTARVLIPDEADVLSITDPDGNGIKDLQGWITKSIIVAPKDGDNYLISETIGKGSFCGSLKLGDTHKDQGEKNRVFYLRNKKSGAISRAVINDLKIDTVKPEIESVTYSKDDVQKSIFASYEDRVNVTVNGKDTGSGIDFFSMYYINEDGSRCLLKDKIKAVKDDNGMYSACIELPEGNTEEWKGNLAITAVDAAGLVSEEKTDTDNLFVADNTAPVVSAEYKAENGSVYIKESDERKTFYYNGNIKAELMVEEDNFDPDAIDVLISKDEKADRQSVVWKRNDTQESGRSDSYAAEFIIEEEGSYRVSMKGADLAGNSMEHYESDSLVIDKTAPVINAEFESVGGVLREDTGNKYFNSDVTAVFTVKEKNFYKDGFDLNIYKNGNKIESPNIEWSDETNDIHIGRCIISAENNDGSYVFDVSCCDLSQNTGSYNSSEDGEYADIIIDTTAPVINISYDISSGNTDTDFEGYEREYFDATRTAEVTVIEENFDKELVSFFISSRNVKGEDIGERYSLSEWTDNGNKHTLTIIYPGDANYTFDVDKCTDMAGNDAAYKRTDRFTVDKTPPENTGMSFSTGVLDTVISGIPYCFYRTNMRVNISAHDDVSGVRSFKYSCLKAAGAGGANTELKERTIDRERIVYSDGGAAAEVSFDIPGDIDVSDSQFNGTVRFSATDRAGNSSAETSDQKRIVVDSISPVSAVTFNSPVQTSDGVSYYDGAINADIRINEANFFAEDVNIKVLKDGEEYKISPLWTEQGADIHIGSFSITEDGEYIIKISYTDKSTNQMAEYTSQKMIIDTKINAPVILINEEEANGKAFRDKVVPHVSFSDENFEDYTIKLTRTRRNEKNTDVTNLFTDTNMTLNDRGGEGVFDVFEMKPDADGIYEMTVKITDKAGNEAENNITFTVNRYGSVYVYGEYLTELTADGGAYVREVSKDLTLTEYNPSRLVEGSLMPEVTRDGKPVEGIDIVVSPKINDKVKVSDCGWYQYGYRISKDNFVSDGVYKIDISSKDAAGNSSDTSDREDQGILFRVDSMPPEISSIAGLEESIINKHEARVIYRVFDSIALDSISLFIDGEEIERINDFGNDGNNYEGAFVLSESDSEHSVRLVVSDKAGNITDTASDGFREACAYRFNDRVTVSTDLFIRTTALIKENIVLVACITSAAAAFVIAAFAFGLNKNRNDHGNSHRNSHRTGRGNDQ